VVATGGNRSQIALAPNPRDQAKTVAAGCDRLPIGAHGKERVCHRLPPVAEVPSLWQKPQALRSHIRNDRCTHGCTSWDLACHPRRGGGLRQHTQSL